MTAERPNTPPSGNWRLCERLGAPKLDVVDPVLVMIAFRVAGQWLGLRRYRVEASE